MTNFVYFLKLEKNGKDFRSRQVCFTMSYYTLKDILVVAQKCFEFYKGKVCVNVVRMDLRPCPTRLFSTLLTYHSTKIK